MDPNELQEAFLIVANSKLDTHKHIRRVQEILLGMVQNLQQRMLVHDVSKLLPDEAEVIAEHGCNLRTTTFGSQEYKDSLEAIRPAIDKHYARNSHHPEHYGEAGINGMDLLDLVEMMCDWKAATERHEDGDIFKSLEINKERFGISEQLQTILTNTVVRYLFPVDMYEVTESTPEELAIRQEMVDAGVEETNSTV